MLHGLSEGTLCRKLLTANRCVSRLAGLAGLLASWGRGLGESRARAVESRGTWRAGLGTWATNKGYEHGLRTWATDMGPGTR